MRALVVVAAAVVLLAAAAIALAPASLIAPPIARAGGSRVAVADVEGTLWNGRATLVGSDGARLPFAWTIDRVPLSLGKVRVHLAPRGTGATPRGDVEWKSGNVHAQDISLVVPAAWLAGALAKSLPVALSGDVDVLIGSLDWTPPASRGDAQVAWRNARVAAPGGSPLELGTVSATLSANGDRIAGAVSNDGGDLAIAGDVSARADGAGETNLLLTPRRADDAGLARALTAIGTPEGNGYRVRLRWPGQ